ncbi:MAG: efflux RND transporter periplasmic adaptor subunit [Gammaproteobacteria bacterium]|nr:efflux RND transporter periplasmic adaptor subunit [Gammaproteobacteria bacterium]
MNTKLKKLLPVGIFALLLAIALLIRMNPPETEKRPAFGGPVMVVDVVPVETRDYQVRLQSYGTVQPRTSATLIAQVSGQIVSVNPNVRDGGFFDKGDVLATIDSRDYEADVRIAEAVLMDARQALAEAEARSEQAREDWARLGNEGPAPDLVLRVPQLEAARARVKSAESTLRKAELDLERTRIVAPFDGRILKGYADLGQVVNVNSPLADIYATDYVEIRLPLRNRDLDYIELPERFRDQDTTASTSNVRIVSELIGNASWDAKLVRTEGAIDETARQLHVIAQIDDPFAGGPGGLRPPKIGQYVTAELTGKILQDVLVVPNSAIYQGSYVYVVEDNLLRRRDVDIDWQNDTEAVISAGLRDGDSLVITPLGQVTSGIRVSVSESGPAARDRRSAGASSGTGQDSQTTRSSTGSQQ